MTVGVATPPVVRALLDAARRDGYSGALGVHAAPRWDGPEVFEHDGQRVRVVPCVSTLAVRRALRDRDPESWVVVLTDRADADLGAGLLGHLAWYRLRTPDPWDAVRQRFAAVGLDPALVGGDRSRDLAVGLLAAAPPGGWPPAPGGVLTRDHALAVVARLRLGVAPGGAEIAAPAVLAWTAEPAAVGRLADLRSDAGDAVADAVLRWAAERVGVAGTVIAALLASGRAADVVPLGLVAGLLADAAETRSATGAGGLIALRRDLGAAHPPKVLQAWAREAAAAVEVLLAEPVTRRAADRVLARSDRLLAEFEARDLAASSPLLPAGLDARLARLGVALRGALAAADRVPDPDAPLVSDPAGVESAGSVVAEHRLAESDPRTRVSDSAVRLVRWLGAPAAAPGSGIAALTARHVHADAWVDAAMDDVCGGAVDQDLAAALNALAAVVRRRRDAHDRAFAAALAAHTDDDHPEVVRHVEDVLPGTVLPLARTTPALLLVCDGMSVAVATEVVAAAEGEGWQEALLAEEAGRAAALAVLPSLTDPSRTSLLSGELRAGSRDVESRAYRALARAAGLPGEAPLFHKGPLDSSRLGHAIADDVGAALDDLDRRPLVTCVLNAVDDALDRSDPGGTVWSLDAVKHLRPLLDRARRAGRVVVLTADHGHLVERRQGAQRRYAGASSGRSRPAGAEPVAGDEVLVAGRRVLTPDSRAVLAVDERLRYGPLKAGYHGGASPAEVVVPLVVLVSGGLPEDAGLRLATPQEPEWWDGPVTTGPALAQPRPTPAVARPAPAATPTLFDEPEPEPSSPGAVGVVAAVLRSRTYAEQKSISGRLAVTDQQIGRLVTALLTAPDRRLAPARAAVALGVPVAALRGALLHATRALNVEGYPVLQFDADGITVVLDESLLREQFEFDR